MDESIIKLAELGNFKIWPDGAPEDEIAYRVDYTVTIPKDYVFRVVTVRDQG